MLLFKERLKEKNAVRCRVGVNRTYQFTTGFVDCWCQTLMHIFFSFTLPWMVHLIHVSRKGSETLILLQSKGPLRVDRCIYKSTWTAVFQPHALLIQTLSPSEIMISIPPHPLAKLFGSASLFWNPHWHWYSYNVFLLSIYLHFVHLLRLPCSRNENDSHGLGERCFWSQQVGGI